MGVIILLPSPLQLYSYKYSLRDKCDHLNLFCHCQPKCAVIRGSNIKGETHPCDLEDKFSGIFSSPGRSPGRAIILPPVSAAAAALAKCFYVKVFYVMGKALSGELSCPCDRSCLSVFSCHLDNSRLDNI